MTVAVLGYDLSFLVYIICNNSTFKYMVKCQRRFITMLNKTISQGSFNLLKLYLWYMIFRRWKVKKHCKLTGVTYVSKRIWICFKINSQKTSFSVLTHLTNFTIKTFKVLDYLTIARVTLVVKYGFLSNQNNQHPT